MFAARPSAKVNLTLEVGPLGDDGYHALRSIFLRIGLADRIGLGLIDGVGDQLAVDGLPGAPLDENIVLRALALLRERAGIALPPVEIELDKRIPVAAGLGGGSSDAAATLVLAQACWGIGLSSAQQAELAARLGSDVPFFVAGAPVGLVEGRGEIVRPLPAVDGEAGLLLVTPRAELSTRAVFARHDALAARRPGGRGSVSDDLAAALEEGLTAKELCAWAGRLREANDLWPAAAALEPGLPELREELERRTDRPWLLSGSGPTLLALYPSPTDAVSGGMSLVDAPADRLASMLLHATNLSGPDPAWRHP